MARMIVSYLRYVMWWIQNIQLNWDQHQDYVYVQVQEMWMAAKLHQKSQAWIKIKIPLKKLWKQILYEKMVKENHSSTSEILSKRNLKIVGAISRT